MNRCIVAIRRTSGARLYTNSRGMKSRWKSMSSPATITQIAIVARIGSRSPTIVVVARSAGAGG